MYGLKIGLLIFVGIILQLTLIGRFEILGGKADLLLIFTVYFAISRGSLAGAIIGFISGLLLELFSAAPLGLEAFGKTVIGYSVGALSKRLYINLLSTQLAFNFLSVIGSKTLILMMLNLKLKLSRPHLFELLKQRNFFLVDALVNTALSPILFILLAKVFDKFRSDNL